MRAMRPRTARLLTALLACAPCLLTWHGCARGERSTRYPNAPIELVVPFQPGGGSDTLARMIQAIVSEQRLVTTPVNIVNKPGGAGAIGLAYATAKKGDRHTLMTAIDTLVAVPLQPGYRGPSHRDLTIVAILALDDLIVVVPANSPFRTMDDLMRAAVANPGRLKLATNAAGGEDHIFGGLIERASGAKFTYVHTRGGAEAMQHVVGGHVDLAVPNPSETLSHLEGRLVRALAVGSSKRLDILPAVPTFKERGIDVEYQMFRGIVMPAEMPRDVVAFWEETLRKVTESERWKKEYLARLALTPRFMIGADAARFVDRVETTYQATLKQLGVVE